MKIVEVLTWMKFLFAIYVLNKFGDAKWKYNPTGHLQMPSFGITCFSLEEYNCWGGYASKGWLQFSNCKSRLTLLSAMGNWGGGSRCKLFNLFVGDKILTDTIINIMLSILFVIVLITKCMTRSMILEVEWVWSINVSNAVPAGIFDSGSVLLNQNVNGCVRMYVNHSWTVA